MKKMQPTRHTASWPVLQLGLAGLTALTIPGCTRQDVEKRDVVVLQASTPSVRPLEIALAPHTGQGRLDEQIRHFQEQVRSNQNVHAALERLGWLYVGKARE